MDWGNKISVEASGDYNIGLGHFNSYQASGNYNIALGYYSRLRANGSNNIEIVTQGDLVGPLNIANGILDNKLHIENTIIGDTSSKLLAIGNVGSADLTPDATLEVKPNATTDVGIIVQAVSSHSASLQEWQNSSETKLLAVGPDGGVELPNNVPSTTTNKLYNDAGTLKFNGSAVNTDTNTTYTAGNGLSLSSTTFSIDDPVNLSQLTESTDATDDKILLWDESASTWKYMTLDDLQDSIDTTGGSSLTAGSGVVVDGANKINVHGGTGNFQEIQLNSANTFTPKMVFTGSGVQDTPIRLKVLSNQPTPSTSGTALSFEGTEGQLFGITDNLSSGNIFSVNDITGLPLISADASGDVKLGEFGRYVGIGTGVPLYGFDVSSSGQLQKGVILSDYVPATTTNALYNDGGTLKFNGSAVNTNTQLSTEEVQDIAGPLVATGGTKTLITVTYDDANNNMDFVVDNDLSNYSNSSSNFFDTAGNGLTSSSLQNTVNVVGGDGITANANEIVVTVDDSTIELSASDGTGSVRIRF